MFRGCICFGDGVGFRGHRHMFRQGCGLLIQGNQDFGRISLFHCDRFLDQAVADSCDVETELSGRHVRERERPGFIRSGIPRRATHNYFDFRHWLS